MIRQSILKTSSKLLWFENWQELEGHKLEIFSLDHENFPTPWRPEEWEKLLADGQREFSLGAKLQNGHILGFALFLHDHADSFTHLVKIVVDPKFLRQGIAKEIFDAFLSKGPVFWKKIYLEVESSNLAAHSFYKKLGFQELRVLKDFYGQGRDGLGMLMIREDS